VTSAGGYRERVLASTILERPFDAEGWSAEIVVLSCDDDGALTLEARNRGRVVHLQIGEDVAEYHRRWSVAATEVGRVLEAWLWAACRDTPALVGWLDGHEIPHTAGEWHGYQARPLDEGRVVLAVGRAIIGELAEKDEGSTIAGRFLTWLIERQIPYQSDETLLR
jgi:hypothetical protein